MIVDLKPSGQGYMEDFHRAGGMPRVLRELVDHLDTRALTACGTTLAQALEQPIDDHDQDVIRCAAHPLRPDGTLAILAVTWRPEAQ